MSAASPASSQVRDAAAASRSAAPPRRAAAAGQTFAFAAPSADDEIRLNLSDIPRMQATLDIEGFRPSLLSRLFDLVAPIRANRR